MKKIQRNLTNVFLVLFTGAFGILFVNILINSQRGNNPLLSTALAIIFAVSFFLIFRFLKKNEGFCVAHGKKLLFGFVVFFALIQLLTGLALRYQPAFDLESVFVGGIEWANTGAFETYRDYFHMFPNNLGALLLFRVLFSFSNLFGITDYYLVALVYNVIMLQVMVALVFDICKRIAGHAAAVFSLCAFALFLPFYMMGGVFYTDLLSAPFTALALDLFLIGNEQSDEKKRVGIFALMAVAAAVGAIIKITVSIVAIAAVVNLFLHGKFKNALALSVTAVLVFAAVFGGVNTYIHSRHMDEELLEQRAIPYSHWIAMGLHGSGGYNPQDYEIAKALPNRTARNEANRQLIAERIAQQGAGGMLSLWTRKTAVTFGDGTYALSDFLDDQPVHPGGLHEWVLYDAEHYDAYKSIAQGCYLAFLFFLVISAGVPLLYRQNRHVIAHQLAMLGILLFLMVWETSARYAQNFMPILIVCAVTGCSSAFSYPSRVQRHVSGDRF